MVGKLAALLPIEAMLYYYQVLGALLLTPAVLMYVQSVFPLKLDNRGK